MKRSATDAGLDDYETSVDTKPEPTTGKSFGKKAVRDPPTTVLDRDPSPAPYLGRSPSQIEDLSQPLDTMLHLGEKESEMEQPTRDQDPYPGRATPKIEDLNEIFNTMLQLSENSHADGPDQDVQTAQPAVENDPSLGPYLGKQPAEVRVQIFEFAYSGREITVRRSPLALMNSSAMKGLTEFTKLAVCRSYYSEAWPVLLENAIFSSSDNFAVLNTMQPLGASVRTVSLERSPLRSWDWLARRVPNLRTLFLEVDVNDLGLPSKSEQLCFRVTDLRASRMDRCRFLHRIANIGSLRDVEMKIKACTNCAHLTASRFERARSRFKDSGLCFLTFMAKEAEVLVLRRLWEKSRDRVQRKELAASLKVKADEYAALRGHQRMHKVFSQFDEEDWWRSRGHPVEYGLWKWTGRKLDATREKCKIEPVASKKEE